MAANRFCSRSIRFVAISVIYIAASGWSGLLAAAPKAILVGDFTNEVFYGWEEEGAGKRNENHIVSDNGGNNGTKVLQITSKNSHSSLVKLQRIDLWQTPVLNWRWKIDNRLPTRNETTPEGDDFPLRLYLVHDYSKELQRSQSFVYVWTRGVTKNSVWKNAKNPDNFIMMSLRSATDETGQWYEEKRNILSDLQRYVDPNIRYIDAIAVAADSEDTSGFSQGYFGNIYFTAD